MRSTPILILLLGVLTVWVCLDSTVLAAMRSLSTVLAPQPAPYMGPPLEPDTPWFKYAGWARYWQHWIRNWGRTAYDVRVEYTHDRPEYLDFYGKDRIANGTVVIPIGTVQWMDVFKATIYPVMNGTDVIIKWDGGEQVLVFTDC